MNLPPLRFSSLVPGGRGNRPGWKTIIIDEIQKVLEENKSLRFILTGSSSRTLKRSGVDLLSGRAVVKKLYPFTAAEPGDKFQIGDALKYGLIPLICQADDKEEALEGYVNLYLKEEVHAVGLVRTIAGFARFLEMMSFSNGLKEI